MMLLLRFILLVMLWLSVFSNAVAQSPLDKDDRLNVAVTLHHHVISFSDLVRDLQKQTGVTMEVQRDIMDEKATVFVENKPAREVMEKLASVFLLRWERRKAGGYRLVPDADARKWERDFLALRERIADRLWLEWIQKGYRDVQRGRGWIEQRIDEIDRREQRLHEQGIEEQQVGALFAERERLNTVRRPYGYLAAQVLGSAPYLLWQRLKRGEILIASTQPAPGELPLNVPVDALREILDEQEEPLSKDSYSIQIALRLSEEWLWDSYILQRDMPGAEYFEAAMPRLDMSVTLRSEQQVKSTGDLIRPPVSPDFIQPLTQHPWIKHWQQWQTPEKTLREDPVLSKPFEQSRPSYPLRGYFGELTDADLFCWFHTVTGVPIIMDGSRLIYQRAAPSADTPARWLLAFTTGERPVDSYLIRYENGFVLARRKAYLDLRQWEIPERLLLSLEAKVLKGEALSLDDYAGLAAQITDKQVRMLPAFFFPMPVISTRFDLANLVEANVPMARLWASLTPAQKQALWEGGTVSADELSPAQQQLLWRTLRSNGRTEYLLDGSWGRTYLKITAEENTVYLLRDRGEHILPFTGKSLEEQAYSETVLEPFVHLWGSSALRSCRGLYVELAIRSGEAEVVRGAFLLRDEVLPPLDPPRCLWQETRSQSAKWSAEHDWVVHPRLFADAPEHLTK